MQMFDEETSGPFCGMTLLETVKEMNYRTDALLEICESHQLLIEQLADKIVELQDKIDNVSSHQIISLN